MQSINNQEQQDNSDNSETQSLNTAGDSVKQISDKVIALHRAQQD
jgi:hypothetical protein